MDLINSEKVHQLKDLLYYLNPDCKIIPSEYGNIDLEEILNTGLFSMVSYWNLLFTNLNCFQKEKAEMAPGLFDWQRIVIYVAQYPGWLKEIRGEHIPETLEYGVSSFVFRSRKPFRKQRELFVFNL